MTPPLALKLATTKIATLEKEIWIARILRILDGNEFATAQLRRRLVDDCEKIGVVPITETTFGRYINEMERRGVVVGFLMPMRKGKSRVRYWRRTTVIGGVQNEK